MAKLGALSAPSDFQSHERFLPQCSMGSVGSGVAGQQEFAMKSVGTRTQQSSGGVRSNGFSTREFQRCYSGEEKTYSSEKMLVSNSLYINSEQRRSGERRVKVDLCGNVTTNNERNSSTGNLPPLQYRDPPSTDLSQQPPPISANNTTGNSKLEHPPKILPVSGKLEQVEYSPSLSVCHIQLSLQKLLHQSFEWLFSSVFLSSACLSLYCRKILDL